MLAWLWVPGVTAWLNRYWRGEGRTPFGKWFWFLSFSLVAYAMSLHFYFAVAWLLFVFGYGVLGWHAIFSAITGRPPERMDSAKTDWMQVIACKILRMERPAYFPALDADGKKTSIISPLYATPHSVAQWRRFGMVYGAVRGTLMLPGVAVMILVTQSLLPLVGVAIALGMGFVYELGGRCARHFQLPEDKGVPIAEVIMGWLLGTYLLLCAGLMVAGNLPMEF